MRIAILSPFYPYRGGIAQFSAMLYKELEKEHEVKAFSFSRLYPGFLFPGKTQLVEEGDDAIQIPSMRKLDSIGPFSYFQTAGEIKKFQPDVLVIAYWMSFFSPAYTFIAKQLKRKTRIIALLHNAFPHEPHFFDKPLAKRFFKQCSGFMLMSEKVETDLLSLRPDAQYCLNQHPIFDHFGERIEQEKAREQLDIDTNKTTLLFFGLIRDYKGLDLLIDAMSLLDDSYQLIIAGECYGDFKKYQQQIDASPAGTRIKTMNRYIDDNEVPILFSASDLLVTPYRSATQSGVIPIAYHFEVPVLATDVGGLKETIEKAGTGLVCLPQTESIAQGVQSLFQLGKERFIANIRNEKQLLSWEIFAGKLLDFAGQL
ncbi:MAG: glycosyltransferase [Dysgonamonadaceae bacterium]|jgi:glycosyltransferase involved in cell wall biosynthesis|nr:glycosyltransferase [Dysgonamonadaceae bacterium]